MQTTAAPTGEDLRKKATLSQLQSIARKMYDECPVWQTQEFDAELAKRWEATTGETVATYDAIASGRNKFFNLVDWVKAHNTMYRLTTTIKVSGSEYRINLAYRGHVHGVDLSATEIIEEAFATLADKINAAKAATATATSPTNATTEKTSQATAPTTTTSPTKPTKATTGKTPAEPGRTKANPKPLEQVKKEALLYLFSNPGWQSHKTVASHLFVSCAQAKEALHSIYMGGKPQGVTLNEGESYTMDFRRNGSHSNYKVTKSKTAKPTPATPETTTPNPSYVLDAVAHQPTDTPTGTEDIGEEPHGEPREVVEA